eukprot:gene51648-30538_t
MEGLQLADEREHPLLDALPPPLGTGLEAAARGAAMRRLPLPPLLPPALLAT